MSSYRLIADDGTVYSYEWRDYVDVNLAMRGRGMATVECLRDQSEPFLLHISPEVQKRIVTVETNISEQSYTTSKETIVRYTLGRTSNS